MLKVILSCTANLCTAGDGGPIANKQTNKKIHELLELVVFLLTFSKTNIIAL